MTNEGGGDAALDPTSPRRFGQLPDLGVSDDFDDPLPLTEAAVWEASDPVAEPQEPSPRASPHSDQAWVAIFVEHDVPLAALQCVERKVDFVDGEIGYAAGAEDDDRLSLISAAAGLQADELGVARDDELQVPADMASDLACASVESLHVVTGQHAMASLSGVVGVVAAQRVQLVDQLLVALNGHDDGRGLTGIVGQDDVAAAGGHLIGSGAGAVPGPESAHWVRLARRRGLQQWYGSSENSLSKWWIPVTPRPDEPRGSHRIRLMLNRVR